MTIDHFQALSAERQYQEVQQTGVFLLSRTGVRALAKLYQLHDFYVEVLYRDQGPAVLRLTAYSETGQLRGYLSQISLAELLPLLSR
jgi:hypothetical protein